MLEIITISTVRTFDGLIDFTVMINRNDRSKEYTFTLASERDVDRIVWLLKKRWFGKALSSLKKISLKIKE